MKAPGELLARAAAVPPAGPVPSPCSAVCRMDAASGLCAGCLRTLPEIAGWGQLDDGARRAIWHAITQRAQARTGP